MEPSVDAYKSGSSITLGKYNTKLTEMLPPRSAKLLGLRGPAFPAQSLDLSAELAQENAVRRTMHQVILAQDPSAFKKKERAESASSALHQRFQVKDLLGDMHQLKDFKDINKTKKFTRSILFEQDRRKSMTLKEYQFQTMKPIEDFVRPDDQLSPRVTGYEHGHIRSLLKLDVYGPAASVAIERERELGVLPRSPNIDRHQLLNPQHTLHLRPGTGQSNASSPSSTVGSTSYNGAFPSLKTLRREHAASKSKSSVESSSASPSAFHLGALTDHPMRSRTTISPTFGASTNSNNNNNNSVGHNSVGGVSNGGNHSEGGKGSKKLGGSRVLSRAGSSGSNVLNTSGAVVEFAGAGIRPATGSSVGTGTRSSVGSFGGGHNAGPGKGKRSKYPEQTFAGVAIAEEERLLGGDPFLRRTTWYKHFASSKKDEAESREAYKKELRYAKMQQEVAEQERRRMKEFDDYLVLAKYNP